MKTHISLALLILSCGSTPQPSTTANTILVTVSGEEGATNGTAFPPALGGNEPYFLDGWEIKYQHVLVSIGNVTVSEAPDTNPNDQSVTGITVAEAVGPWAVDLAQEGALEAKEQNGTAIELTRINKQNKKPGSPDFDATTKYAFGYSLLAATEGAQNINLDAQAQEAYRLMTQRGWSVWLQGTATWKGTQSSPACRSTQSTYDFGRLPKTVHFSFGFKAPVNFKNCINPDLQPANSRGIQTATNAQVIAQITFHLDHPFWESLAEDAPLRFDAIAARKSVPSGMGPALAEMTEADLSFDFQAPQDAQQQPIPWRSCGPVETGERSGGTVYYDPLQVPANPAGGAQGLSNLYEYMNYNLSTFGHLNNDGLCFPDRQFPSPR